MRCTEPNKVWKSFHQAPLTHSEAHYLMTLYEKPNLHAVELSKSLKISPPSVSQALKTLVKKNWIIQNKDKSFYLKEEKKEIIAQIIKNKALLMDFFVNILKLPKDIADRDSCKIEHLLSLETTQSLEQFLHKTRHKK